MFFCSSMDHWGQGRVHAAPTELSCHLGWFYPKGIADQSPTYKGCDPFTIASAKMEERATLGIID